MCCRGDGHWKGNPLRPFTVRCMCVMVTSLEGMQRGNNYALNMLLTNNDDIIITIDTQCTGISLLR